MARESRGGEESAPAEAEDSCGALNAAWRIAASEHGIGRHEDECGRCAGGGMILSAFERLRVAVALLLR